MVIVFSSQLPENDIGTPKDGQEVKYDQLSRLVEQTVLYLRQVQFSTDFLKFKIKQSLMLNKFF